MKSTAEPRPCSFATFGERILGFWAFFELVLPGHAPQHPAAEGTEGAADAEAGTREQAL